MSKPTYHVHSDFKNTGALTYEKYARRGKTRVGDPVGYRDGWDDVFTAECPDHGRYRKVEGCKGCGPQTTE